MQYKERQDLAIVDMNSNEETLSLHKLTEIIWGKPSNIVFCERNGKLHGIVSMGDIARGIEEKADCIAVNTHFTFILCGEQMKARKIFHDKININALPVVNEDNVLLGAYSRWDDLLINRYILRAHWGGGVQTDWHRHIAFVRPREIFEEKQQIFEECYKYLELRGVIVEVIKPEDVLDWIEQVEWMLFVDEDEQRAIDTLAIIWGIRSRKLITWRKYFEYENMEACLKGIKKEGVHIFSLCFRDSEYYRLLGKDVSAKYAALGAKKSFRFLPAMYKDFFADLYTEEYAEVITHLCFSVESKSGCSKLKDACSRFYNVTNGERHTAGQPEQYRRTIYFVGPCFVYGHYVEDKNTIESFLQNRLNDGQYDVKVVNCGSPSYASNVFSLDVVQARLSEIPLRRGDIVIIYVYNRHFLGTTEINLMNILESYDVNAGWMIDIPQHCNHKLNSLYAEAIYEKLKPALLEPVEKQEKLIEVNTDFIKEIYINRYFKEFDSSKYKKIGSIVMNCNPFTNGHRHLIVEALQKVDFLIIFVVEEDRSVFSFAERFGMVYDGVADLNNVMVVPSGPFILAQTTFPEYFIKTADEDLIENVENDIMLFAKHIAPHLNIRYRFVGEEPEDRVTNEYNLAMKRILPHNSIELIEIPRKRQNGKYISASFVRKCLESNDLNMISELVPESTMRILFN